MSSMCMYVLRNTKEQEDLKRKLVFLAKSKECGIWFEPVNNLLLLQMVKLNPCDFAFEVCDNFGSNVAELLLSYEGILVDGELAPLPLFQRLQILQDVAATCVPHTDKLEIFLSDDDPYLPDYSDYKLVCEEIADTLYEEYQKEENSPFLPCVHLTIEREETQGTVLCVS